MAVETPNLAGRVRALYNRIAPFWHKDVTSKVINEIRDKEVELILRHLKLQPDDRVLHIGIGAANDEIRMKLDDSLLQSIRWIGFDTSRDMLLEAARFFPKVIPVEGHFLEKVGSNANPDGFVGLPFQSASTDKCLSHHVFCHIDDLDKAFAEIHRLLKPGGRITFCELVEPTTAVKPIFPRLYPKHPDVGIRAEFDQTEIIRPASAFLDSLARNRFTISGFDYVTADCVNIAAVKIGV